MGNLGGIRDSTFPENKQPRGYGLYADNVFLTGEFYLNNGQSVVDFSQDGVFLKYKEAGLSIADDPETGDPIISLEAKKVWIGDPKGQIGTLFKIEGGKAYINTDFIKAQKLKYKKYGITHLMRLHQSLLTSHCLKELTLQLCMKVV